MAQTYIIVQDNRTRRPQAAMRKHGESTYYSWESTPALCILKVALQMAAEGRNPSCMQDRNFGGAQYYMDKVGSIFKRLEPVLYQVLLDKSGGDVKRLAKIMYDRMHKGFTPKSGPVCYSSEHYIQSETLKPYIGDAQRLYGV